ncbi:hypothetical protein Egran_03023 [Elaphomyces granulatus]|uniref:SAM-dependent MTase RsmB/NOP-type domain-containing protein n=1 Tax=Elaphomyces granulatus TaxID=519963 RepID=A0A232LYR4_9EURO|nr:hypothetical protein Egran_03023 [Elaphomyces granulatus]
MSLYYDGVAVLTTTPAIGGSFKSRIYSSSNSLKASPAQVFALVTEAAKWDIVLKEVIEKADLLSLEPKLTPLLALLLVHDLLLSKKGIATPTRHPLRQAVDRHRIRLKAELTKVRVRRGCSSLEELQTLVLRDKRTAAGAKSVAPTVRPRWVRVNSLRTTLDAQLRSTFVACRRVQSLSELAADEQQLYVDDTVPDLVAVSPAVDVSSLAPYRSGALILQDKASCFPAYLLLGGEGTRNGDLVDGCAAPGNKTTHLAALRKVLDAERSVIFSMDASAARSQTLQKMVAWAGADHIVAVLAGQDFLAVDPTDPRFRQVSGLLLDPSCSGSGIIGREDVPRLALPISSTARSNGKQPTVLGKKRKRGATTVSLPADPVPVTGESAAEALEVDRLRRLSNLQTRIVEHALSFPAAERVTYSTCSTHVRENESVVCRVLTSDVARRRRWRIMRRDEQPAGLGKWKHRGIHHALTVDLSDVELDACLRCWPGDEEGTSGFFVAGFVRDERAAGENETGRSRPLPESHYHVDDDDEWEGFSD